MAEADGTTETVEVATPDSQAPAPADDGKKEEGSSTILAGDDQPDDQKPEGEGEGSDEKKAEEAGAPEEYAEFSVPEGLVMDEAGLAEALPLFKELNLSQTQAQQLVDLYARQEMQRAEARQDEMTNLVVGWGQEVDKLPGFQGDKRDRTVAMLRSQFDGYPDRAQLEAEMNKHGFGNNPELVKFMVWNAERLNKAGILTEREGKFVPAQGQPGRGQRDARDFYPNTPGLKG